MCRSVYVYEHECACISMYIIIIIIMCMCLLIYVGIFTCKAPRALFWICALHKYSLLLLLLLIIMRVFLEHLSM